MFSCAHCNAVSSFLLLFVYSSPSLRGCRGGSFDAVPDRDVAAASRLAARIISSLWATWPTDVELFNVNIPVFKAMDADSLPVHRTAVFPNQCDSIGSL